MGATMRAPAGTGPAEGPLSAVASVPGGPPSNPSMVSEAASSSRGPSPAGPRASLRSPPVTNCHSAIRLSFPPPGEEPLPLRPATAVRVSHHRYASAVPPEGSGGTALGCGYDCFVVDACQPAGQGTLMVLLRKSFRRMVTEPNGAVG